MVYTLLQLLATRPQLLVEHAQAYADLVLEEIDTASNAWRRGALLCAAALCCVGVAAVLGGVALMLWATIPAAPAQALWVLIGTPLAFLTGAVWCLLAARAAVERKPFDNVRRQIEADMAMLREVSAA